MLQTKIQEELQNLIKNFERDFVLKAQIFQSKLERFTNLKKIIPSVLALLVTEIRKNIQSMYRNNVVKKNMLTYY